MIKKVLSFASTSTFKDTSVVSAGTLLNLIFGGLFFIIAPRILGPANFGLFSTVVATSVLIISFANLGIDAGILRYVKKDSNQNDQFLSLAFKSYLIIGFIISIAGFLFSPLIANILDHKEISDLLRIAFASSLFLLLGNFYTAGLQALGKFTQASLVNLSSNVLRIIILIIALYFWHVGLIFITCLFFMVTVVSTIVGKIFLPFSSNIPKRDQITNFYKYNFWVAIALLVSSIPFDNFLLLKYAGPVSVGLYAAPFKILSAIYQFGSSYSRVLVPRFASFDKDTKVRSFISKAYVFPLLLSAAILILSLFSSHVIILLFGRSYLDAAVLFQVLSVGFIFFLLAVVPGVITLYYYGDSRFAFYASIVRTIIFVAAILVLINNFKALGAAVAFTIAEFVNFALLSIYVIVKLKKNA